MESLSDFILFKQGAEGKLYTGTYLGKPTIAKERFKKKYRHPDLDELITKERMRSESRAIVRCLKAGIKTPTLYLIDMDTQTIFMEYFQNAVSVKEYIETHDMKNLIKLSYNIGLMIGKMHLNNVIHGDLTSSNLLLWKEDNAKDKLELVLIDFGLAHTDGTNEDKGVDLYVLERALLSTHAVAEDLFPEILKGYESQNKKTYKQILSKYNEVRARGRKRTMVG